jgi:hypothetical protein
MTVVVGVDIRSVSIIKSTTRRRRGGGRRRRRGGGKEEEEDDAPVASAAAAKNDGRFGGPFIFVAFQDFRFSLFWFSFKRYHTPKYTLAARGLEEHVRITLIFSRIISFRLFTVLRSGTYVLFRRISHIVD